MKLRSALLAATVLAAPVAAMAQPVDGVYIGLGAGYNWLDQQNLKQGNVTLPNGSVLVSPLSGHVNFHSGYAVLGSVGYGFGNGLRAEVEGDYRQNQLQNLSASFGSISGRAGAGGDEQQAGVMVNALYDFWGLSPYVVPYIGAGIGYQSISESNVKIYAPGGLPFATINQSRGAFAYQGIVGVAIPLTQVTPGLALTLEGRFMGTTGNRNYGGTIYTAAGSVPASVRFNNNYNASGLVGIRYAFNAAPPPPPPAPAPVAAPAPAPARTYLVFFDWDRADLTARARQIVADAARNSTHVQYTRIEVNGYTDTSGTPAYNLGLSVRRAQSVKAELIRDGVPANVIDIHGFGDTHLLVPTGPGVREPQNRRVEIILR
jgi:outer membrane protein OmpA-like peptidoglycan-associated protein